MKIIVDNYDNSIDSTDFDIVHRQLYGIETVVDQSSIVKIWYEEKCISLKLELEQALVADYDFCLVPETGILFYRSFKEWCVFDINDYKVIRVKEAFYFPSIVRKNNTILIYDELSVYSLDLTGNIIDDVPVDPPYEEVYHEDGIEFNSPVFGKQFLRLNN